MSKELSHIRSRLAVEGEKTARYFEALSTVDWEQQIYTTGSRWQAKQVLSHFISAERAYQKYIQDVLNGGEGAPDDLDIDAFNEAEAPKLSNLPAGELISRYRLARADTLKMVDNLDEADLTRQGFHPWFGEKDLSWYLKLLYRHNTMHLQDVRKAIEVAQALPPTGVVQAGGGSKSSSESTRDE